MWPRTKMYCPPCYLCAGGNPGDKYLYTWRNKARHESESRNMCCFVNGQTDPLSPWPVKWKDIECGWCFIRIDLKTSLVEPEYIQV